MTQTTKTIVGAIAALVILSGLTWAFKPSLFERGGTAVAQPVVSGVIGATEDFFDFGTISMLAGKVTRKFTLKNSSDAPVRVTKLFTSCMCTQASIATQNDRRGPFGMQGHGGSIPKINLEIKPGETAEVEAVFDPAAHGPAGVGKVRRVVYVETDSSEAPEIQLSFEANVTP